MTKLPQHLLDYCGVATHIHSTFPLNPTCSGKQSITEVVEMATDLGFSGVAFAEHTTDPGAPSTPGDDLYTAIDIQVAEVEELEAPVRLFTGFEANILPSGNTDVHAGYLAQWSDVTIASQHGGLGAEEKDAAAILRRLTGICKNPFVTTIGHPTRYNDDVAGVDWPQIFAIAQATNTVIELNLNLWFSKGPGRGLAKIKDERWYDGQINFWFRWTAQLAASGAPAMIGLDTHNEGMWPQEKQVEGWETTIDHFSAFIDLIESAGIKPSQVVNSSLERFDIWVNTYKDDRSQLVNW